MRGQGCDGDGGVVGGSVGGSKRLHLRAGPIFYYGSPPEPVLSLSCPLDHSSLCFVTTSTCNDYIFYKDYFILYILHVKVVGYVNKIY